MTTIIRGLYATDMMAVNRPRGTANDCSCGHDTPGADRRTFGNALDAAIAPRVEAKALATAALAHYGIAADSGKRPGFNDRMKKIWGR